MTNTITHPVEIDETILDETSGGLLAVQKVREAANRSQAAGGSGLSAGKVSYSDLSVMMGGPRMTSKNNAPVRVEEDALDDVQGGLMLLPAVQKVREAAARMTGDVNGDGFDDIIVGSTAGSAHVK